jgi:protoporphyrinogen/coproporphyrinogen III oxidase
MSVAILGGGISGLTAAFSLSLRNPNTKVKLYEASGRFGGWIKTDRKNEYVFEAGPRTIRPKGIAGNTTLELIDRLGLSKAIIPIGSKHIAATRRMVYAKNQLCLLPNDLNGLFKVMPPFSKPLYKAGIKDFFGGKSKKPLEDESIYDFASRRFGKELADYAGDAKQISVKFLMKNLFEKEQKFGGVIRGIIFDFLVNGKNRIRPAPFTPHPLFKKAQMNRWSIYSLAGGLETLPKTLVKKLSEAESVSLNLNANCEKIRFKAGGPVELTVNGVRHSAKHLISTLPSYRLAQLVNHQHPRLADELKMIKCVDVAVINLHYKGELLKEQGFGLLIPPIENLPILGIIFDSCCFEMEGQTVLTVMAGGRWFEKWFGADPKEQDLLKVSTDHVAKILGIHQKPDNFKVNILRNCIPQYVLGHHDRVERIRSYISEKKLPLSICGASYDGVGVNDVILSAANAVKSLENE